jgi:hypothetical protein
MGVASVLGRKGSSNAMLDLVLDRILRVHDSDDQRSISCGEIPRCILAGRVKEGFGRIAGHRIDIGSSKLCGSQTREESGNVGTDGLYCLIVEETYPYCERLHRFQLE